MSGSFRPEDLMDHTINLASAYLSCNSVGIDEVSSVLKTCFQAVTDVGRTASNPNSGNLTPAVPVEESVYEDHIVCLEDGKKLQMLKRHLWTCYRMTVEQYKEKWGLPVDYPTVAPAYAKKRSNIAKETGLGSGGRGSRTGQNSVSSSSTGGQSIAVGA
jgi:predicted transcriptional regulator